MVFLSLGLRAVVNVEALNMVESVGNIVRHRKAAVVYRHGDSYVIRWVPAVSGESIAHSYQSWLANLAALRGLPVCEYCSRGEFVKHADRRVFGSLAWEQELARKAESVEAEKERKRAGKEAKEKSGEDLSKVYVEFIHEFEKTVVANCVVEDIGGFLYAGKVPVKRTSRIASSYMIPALDAVEKAVVESQFQVRHAPTASQKWEEAQMPYNVEVASAVYAISFYIDLDQVGCTSAVKRECLDTVERKKRVELALDALALMLDTRIFGAKQTRFNPVVEYEVVLATLSHPLPFNVSPPASGRDFALDTANRARVFTEATNSTVSLHAYARDEGVRKALEERGVKTYSTLLEMLVSVKKIALELMG